jgi:aspartate/methionine/tyrosine aminotransferase
MQRRPLKAITDPSDIQSQPATKRQRRDVIEDGLLGSLKNDLKSLATHIRTGQIQRVGMENPELALQETLFLPRELNIASHQLTGGESLIDASVGSSGFLAPKRIFAAINTFQRGEVVEYEYKDVGSLETNLGLYLGEEGVLPENMRVEFTSAGQVANSNTMYVTLGCGSQHILSTLFNVIIKHPNDIIVIPTPSYGLLFKSIKSAEGDYKFLPLKAEDNFKPNAQSLIALITRTNDDLRLMHQEAVKFKINKIKKYIPKHKESRAIYLLIHKLEDNLKSQTSLSSKIIRKLNLAIGVYVMTFVQTKGLKNPLHSKIYKVQLTAKLQVPFRNCVRGYLHINPHNPTGAVMTQPEVDLLAQTLAPIPKLTIVEDLAHKDISLSAAKIGFFTRTPVRDRTVSVFSFSKSLALTGMRSGFGIGPHRLIDKVHKHMYESQVFPPLSVPRTVNAVITTPQAKRISYFNKCNTAYQFRLALLKAFVYGIHTITDPALQARVKEKMRKMDLQMKHVLDTGISNLSLLGEPEGCFFAVLDLSEYSGHFIGETQLTSSVDFANFFFYLADVQMVPNEVNGYFDKPTLRFSLTISDDEICRALLRIKHAIVYLTEEPNPKFKYTMDAEAGTIVKRQSMR